MRTSALTAVPLLLLLTGCSGAAVSSSTPIPTGGRIDIVVIGDSLADTANHCPGCTGFADTFAAHVEDTLGRPATTGLITAMSVPDAQAAVEGDEDARSMLADAEVIIVEVGYNNVLPDPETGIGCGGSLEQGVPAWIATLTEECLDPGVATYGEIYGAIFSELHSIRGDEPTVYIATNTLDGNIGSDDPQGFLALFEPGERAAAKKWTVTQYDRWNAMLAEQAASAEFALVDIYHAFNGDDGTAEFGELSIDGAHPSQSGNDLIAQMLSQVDLAALSGS